MLMKSKTKLSPNDTRIHQALKNFGLTENEILIYTHALQSEESSPYSLSQSTGIPRTTVYDVLMGLSLKGLVELQQSDGLTKQQTRVKAKNPSVLRHILQQKRKQLTGVEVDIVEILPLLKGEYHADSANADFQFFAGIEGAKKVYFSEPLDQPNLQTIVFDNQMPMDTFGNQETNQLIDVQIQSKKNNQPKNKELFVLTDWTRHVLTYQYQRDPNYINYQELRYLDNPLLVFNQRIAITGTRIMVTCAQDEEIWGMVINSKALSTMFTSIFHILWSQAQPVTVEFMESLGDNEFYQAEKLKKLSQNKKGS